jgi:tripartite-type tricarboxylate transporter receptor subunit TctC
LGGHIEVQVCPVDFSFVRTGQIRLLTSFGESRLPSSPEVPTWKELGYNIRITHLAALIGPKGLPKPVVDKLHGVFKEAMENPAFKRVMKDLEMPIVYSNPDDLSREFKELTDYYKKLVSQIGLKE